MITIELLPQRGNLYKRWVLAHRNKFIILIALKGCLNKTHIAIRKMNSNFLLATSKPENRYIHTTYVSIHRHIIIHAFL